MRVLPVAMMLVAVSAAGAGAQSLGEVARKEAERRKAVKTPGKLYTNEDLRADPRDAVLPAAPPPASAGTPAAPAGSAEPDADAAPPQEAGATQETPKDEKYWRGRIQAEREALSRAQMFADALQSRINGLTADFTARDDPAQRATIANDRQKALDELGRVKKEIDQHTTAIDAIQDDARRAGVPAGWLR